MVAENDDVMTERGGAELEQEEPRWLLRLLYAGRGSYAIPSARGRLDKVTSCWS